MKFSIVIPTYNRAHFILQSIQSALEQTYTDFEVLVIDDGSTDNTENIIKSQSLPGKLTYYKKENAERGAARNFGMKKATGEYITFLDSDDLLYSCHLQDAYETILQKNNPEVFHLGYEIKKPDGKILKQVKKLPPLVNHLLIKGNPLSCAGIFIRSDIAKSNLFNETRSLSALEDWELWLRLAAQFPFHTNNTISSVVINHDERSVLLTKKEKLLERFNTLFDIVFTDKTILTYYKGQLNLFKSSCHTYIALHLALTKKYQKETISYLLKGIRENPKAIFSRRFLAIIKHFLF